MGGGVGGLETAAVVDCRNEERVGPLALHEAFTLFDGWERHRSAAARPLMHRKNGGRTPAAGRDTGVVCPETDRNSP
jgi:hypothetical protein